MDLVVIDVGVASDRDVQRVADAFRGWPGKDAALYARYLDDQSRAERVVFVAEVDAGFVGYACVLWRSTYGPFADAEIPEIVDLNVVAGARRRGVGSALMDAAEAAIEERSPVAGLGVGLYADYGPALLMYLKRGYRPDGRGIAYAGRTVEPGKMIRIDDDATLMLTRRFR